MYLELMFIFHPLDLLYFLPGKCQSCFCATETGQSRDSEFTTQGCLAFTAEEKYGAVGTLGGGGV